MRKKMMRITTELLRKHKACEKQVKLFSKTYPRGIKASGENAVLLAAGGFDVLWAIRLLPFEGPGSQRAFNLWCVEQVAYLSTDPRVKQCLDIIRKEVLHPGSQDLIDTRNIYRDITHGARTAAWKVAKAALIAANPIITVAEDVAWTSTSAAAQDAARTYARGSSWSTVWNIMQEAQIFMLGEMLRDME